MVDDVYLGLALCICYSKIVEAGVHNPTTEIHYLNTVVICFNLSITLTHWTRCKNKSVVKKSNLGPESGPKTMILRSLIFGLIFLHLITLPRHEMGIRFTVLVLNINCKTLELVLEFTESTYLAVLSLKTTNWSLERVKSYNHSHVDSCIFMINEHAVYHCERLLTWQNYGSVGEATQMIFHLKIPEWKLLLWCSTAISLKPWFHWSPIFSHIYIQIVFFD